MVLFDAERPGNPGKKKPRQQALEVPAAGAEQRHDAVGRRDQWRRCSKMPLPILFGKILPELEEMSRPKLSDSRNTSRTESGSALAAEP
jgi:hypothetical protein